ncbi:MAG TPA: sugar ABC transporter ATP-binding protein [Solirubrobacterales bacterium]|nr:sugar ABC transporter ATP-binding protein [Solirubrobacterales bacterium]
MLDVKDIDKSYGGVQALSSANLTVRAGSVHALLGENGAGKSTLVKIIIGAVSPDGGTLTLDDEEVSFSNSADAARHGVAAVSQELSLFPDLDVLSNLFPMREVKRGPFIDRAAMEARAKPVLEDLGLDVGMRQRVETLSLAERQLVEIAKALVTEPRVLILDEPTSALEASGVETLLGVLKVLRERQVAVVFVSHILEEVMQLCDDITVLRDGRPVLEGEPRTELSVSAIVAAMLGEKKLRSTGVEADTDLSKELAAKIQGGGEKDELRLEGVGVERRLEDIDLTAKPGEVLGLAGLAGSGHLTVLELISGQRRLKSGSVTLPGGHKLRRSMRGAVGSGVAMVTGDRRRYGLMLDKPIWENIAQVRAVALAGEGPLVRKGALRRHASEMVDRLGVKASSIDVQAGVLSGGNQQKLVFAKWLDAEPTLLLLDDPTRGVDVGAKAEMHRLIRAAADAGAIVLLASTDIDEIVEVCDRVAVFFEGRICAEMDKDSLEQHRLLEVMNTADAAPAAS